MLNMTTTAILSQGKRQVGVNLEEIVQYLRLPKYPCGDGSPVSNHSLKENMTGNEKQKRLARYGNNIDR